MAEIRSSNLPAIPLKSAETQVKLAIDALAGRGDINQKALTIPDLVALGIITKEGAVFLETLPPRYDLGDINYPETGTGNGKDGVDGRTSYFHIAYADSADGSVNFNHTSGIYIGTYVDFIVTDSPDYTVYAWNKFEGTDGTDGTDGIPGVNGANGETSYLHLKYSNDGTSFTPDTGAGIGEDVGDWLGQYVDFILADSIVFNDYLWGVIAGQDGIDGVNGSDGIPGADGVDSYFHVAYADNNDGTLNFNFIGGDYIGTYVDSTPGSSSDPALYNWVIIKGIDGTNGIPGVDGVNGETSYLHIKYSPDGLSFSGNGGEDVDAWLGQYVDFILADSNVFTDYTWSKIEGVAGPQGNDGIASYSYTAYGDDLSGSNFSLTYTGQYYMGTFSSSNPTQSTTPSDYTWVLIRGADGADGTGIADVPTVPHSLTTAQSFAAIFLSWGYAAYNGQYGTEIWRSQVDDILTATLIATASGTKYTNNVGEKAAYFYWIRNRNINGVVSGYNSASGTPGASNMVLTAEDFVLDNPDAEFQAFTIANYGDVITPDWKLLLNGQVIVTSDLSIGQLLSGEMQPNTTFTIGNSSIEIGTDGAGLGYMNIAGDGGITGNDYLRVTNGSVTAFVYANGGHVQYKELRRVERGVANHGVEVFIPGFFRFEPTVYLTPYNITVYNNKYKNQNQSLLIQAGEITPVIGQEGSWKFTPLALLALTAEIFTQVEIIEITTSADSYSAISTFEYLLATGGFVRAQISSFRLLNEGTYQKRTSTLDVYASEDTVNYILVGSLTRAHETSLTDLNFDVTITLPYQSDWIFRYDFSSADTTGTFPSGIDVYEYAEDISTTGTPLTLETTAATASKTQLVESTRPVRDGSWELYQVKYAYTYDWTVEGWTIEWSNGDDNGQALIDLPDEFSTHIVQSPSLGSGTGITPVCNGYPAFNTVGPLYAVKSGTATKDLGTILVNAGNTALLHAGQYSADTIRTRGQSVTADCSGSLAGYARSYLSITGFDVTYYYRRVKTSSTTPTNHYKVLSVDVNLGATNISISTAVINYLAVGE